MLNQLKLFLVRSFWSARFREGGIRTWMSEPVVRQHINRAISGSEHVWPLEWFRAWLGGRVLGHGLSLGCGDGALERDVRRKEICRTVVGIDLSEEALDRAKLLAREEELGGIEYRPADFNQLDFRGERFDILFFHQALHHVANLESCLDACQEALTDQGLVYCDEYVGPSRAEWSRGLMAEAEAVYQSLPRSIRRQRRLGLPVDWRDPSEAIRSSEILAMISERFEIVEKRDYGGNLLALIYPHLDLSRVDEAQREDVLTQLIHSEQQLLSTGLPSYCVVVVGRPLPRSSL